jgi:hypothetical protein
MCGLKSWLWLDTFVFLFPMWLKLQTGLSPGLVLGLDDHWLLLPVLLCSIVEHNETVLMRALRSV